MIVNTPINNLGYGIAGYNICKTMAEKNFLECIHPISDPDFELYKDLEKYDWRNQKNYCTSPVVRIWHQHDLHPRLNPDFSHIGFPFFEMDRLVHVEQMSMNACDKIFVASEWAKNVCIDSKITVPIYVVPLGVDRYIFNEANNISLPSTVFFNCGKWEIRKGHDILKIAFEKAFGPEDNVELWMMCEIPFPSLAHVNNHWSSFYKNTNRTIRIIPRQPNHYGVYNIMRKVDCGIFPARAEGWNLEALELLSCGKHLIITNYSAHTEYANSSNSMLINIDNLEIAHDNVWFNGQGSWAKIENDQIDQMVEYMRRVHRAKMENKLETNWAGIETAKTFSWDNTVKKILEGLNYDSGRNT